MPEAIPGLAQRVAANSDAVALFVHSSDDPSARSALDAFSREVLPTLALELLDANYWAIDCTPAFSEVTAGPRGPVLQFDYRDALDERPDLAQLLIDRLLDYLAKAGLDEATVGFVE